MKVLFQRGFSPWLVAATLLVSSAAYAQPSEREPRPRTGDEEITEEGEEHTVDEARPGAEGGDDGTTSAEEVVEPATDALTASDTTEPVEDPEEGPLRVDAELTSLGSTANNLDFRPLDNSTFIDIQETDDRRTFLFTRVAAGLEYDVLDSTTMAVSISHSGLWGGDQLGSTNLFGGVFYFEDLYVDWTPVDMPSLEFGTTIGRQPFSIGGAEEDFFFDDIIDGVTATIDLRKGGRLRLMPIDSYAIGSRPDDFNLGQALGSSLPEDEFSTVGFDGDVNTFRFGGVYENTEIVDGLELRLFGFYADIGAGGVGHTGSDRTFAGEAGNFSDGDYNWLGGTRVGYGFESDAFDIKAYGEFARSGGLDRKAIQIGEFDVAGNGNAFGFAVLPEFRLAPIFGVRAEGQFFYADGAQHASDNGLPFNYGFVSMKGAQTGGLNMDTFAGWHPSAYVGTTGVEFSPHESDRQAGTMVLHGGLGFDVARQLSIDFDGWYFQDTSGSNFDQSDIEPVSDELPYGWTRADLEAEERLGKTLGIELDATLSWSPNDVLSFFALGALFLPGEFYEIEIDRNVGVGDDTQLGAANPATFWALSGGASLEF